MRTSLLTLTAVIALTGCAGGTGTTISMTGERRYEPEVLTVEAGTTVTWRNDSREAHSVTAYESSLPPGAEYFSLGGYRSERLAREHVESLMTEGETFSVKFAVAGTYQYFCIPHEEQGMKGKIIVE